MNSLLRALLLLSLTILFDRGIVLAQSAVLRTSVIEKWSGGDSYLSLDDPKWTFHYNDNGSLDSLSYNGYIKRQLGGLDNMKPFITELYDWESLPPNPGHFYYNIFADLRLVAAEPTPGKIRIYESKLYADDSMGATHVIEYDYDTVSGRVLRFGGYNYSYEDSAGYLVRIGQRSSRHLEAIWKIHRDEKGAITEIEHFTDGMRRDTLRLRQRYEILEWGLHRAYNSARSLHGLDEGFQRFPWLPEGEPKKWIVYKRGLDGMGKGRLTDRQFDSLGRLIRESEDRYERFITYHPSGVIAVNRHEHKKEFELETTLEKRTLVKDLVWEDVIHSVNGRSKFGNNYCRLLYQYSYRYPNGLKGDRFAPNIICTADQNTIKLTINEPLSIKGLTACIIDTNETELWQIPLTGRRTTFVMPKHKTAMLYAVRWKYEGRKIVDQVF
jgi:hypothetical protein